MKRIIKETLKDGSTKYRVESNRTFFGLIPCKWHTCTITIPYGFGDVQCDAVFNTLEKAQRFIGIDTNPVVNRTIVDAQGLLFANSADTKEDNISPSLQVIKEAVINYEIPHGYIEFDNTMESWAKQGILLINSALTCEVNKVGSHYNIWKNFMSSFLKNMSKINSGIIYVLFGNQAQSFQSFIKGQQYIINEYHPAYYARRCEKMPYSTFLKINKILVDLYEKGIQFYKEINYGTL